MTLESVDDLHKVLGFKCFMESHCCCKCWNCWCSFSSVSLPCSLGLPMVGSLSMMTWGWWNFIFLGTNNEISGF